MIFRIVKQDNLERIEFSLTKKECDNFLRDIGPIDKVKKTTLARIESEINKYLKREIDNELQYK